VFEMLERANAALVWADRPGARVRLPVTADWAYLRFHQGRADGPDYAGRKLRRWAHRIAELPVADAYIYFNNDPGGAAVRDASTMQRLLLERSVVVAAPAADRG
jgi:uncharacterized protein YecE (DUF72 family)